MGTACKDTGMPKRSRKQQGPRDLNQLAHSIVARATGEESTETEEEAGNATAPDTEPPKDPTAVALGRKGGLKGGKARAAKLTPEQRTEAARLAAGARWKKSGPA